MSFMGSQKFQVHRPSNSSAKRVLLQPDYHTIIFHPDNIILVVLVLVWPVALIESCISNCFVELSLQSQFGND
jgi:hypothetical protein